MECDGFTTEVVRTGPHRWMDTAKRNANSRWQEKLSLPSAARRLAVPKKDQAPGFSFCICFPDFVAVGTK
eukprot:1600992-Amphidinium_carterae.1